MSPEGPGFSPAAAAAEATRDARKLRQAPAGREGGASSSSSSSSASASSASASGYFGSSSSPSPLLPFSAKETTTCALFSGAGAPILIVERGLAARREAEPAAREVGVARRISCISKNCSWGREKKRGFVAPLQKGTLSLH